MTDCNQNKIQFQGLDQRNIEAAFNGGHITSDAGALLLREADKNINLLSRFSECFEDHRNQDLIEHDLLSLVSQRTYGLCLGYEDLNDHDDLRKDLLLSTLVEKDDIEGKERKRKQDQGSPLAGKSTLNRLELTPAAKEGINRYHKVLYHPEYIDRLLVDIFLESYRTPPKDIILDLDTTDDSIHGEQEGRFYHGYYGNYCYLPLYIFCGEHLLLSRLQTSNIDGAVHSVCELKPIVEQIRKHWPEIKIILRGDSGFCRDELMSWCEKNNIDFIFGLSKNKRLLRRIGKKLHKSRRRYYSNGKASRRYHDFRYRTKKSWTRSRRVIGKAEYLSKGANPRFIVTSLNRQEIGAKSLYEQTYCARGDMENRIKEQQMGLFADRTSTEKMRSNQLRLYFSSIA